MKSAWIFFAVFLCTFRGISSLAASRIDADFNFKQRLRREGAIEQTRAQNSFEFLYKNFLARSMYSECQWYPSDSQILNLATRNCGVFRGTVLAVSRFMLESDAPSISSALVHDYSRPRILGLRTDGGRLRFQWYNYKSREPASGGGEGDNCEF